MGILIIIRVFVLCGQLRLEDKVVAEIKQKSWPNEGVADYGVFFARLFENCSAMLISTSPNVTSFLQFIFKQKL